MTAPLINPRSKREQKFWRIACHEAGHATVAHHYGCRSGRVSIGLNNDGGAGRSTMGIPQGDDLLEWSKQVAVCALAGPVAEELFARRFPAYGNTAALPALEIGEHLSCGGIPDSELVHKIEQAHRPDGLSEDAACDHAYRFGLDCSLKAIDILKANSVGLRLLALDLINSLTVDASRVNQLMRRHQSNELALGSGVRVTVA